jgi:outer membrane protein TolC
MNWVRKHHPIIQRANLQLQKTPAQMRQARGNFDPKLYGEWDVKAFDKKNYFNFGEGGVKIPTLLGADLKAGYTWSNGVFLNPERNVPANGQAVLGFEVRLLRGLIIDEGRAEIRKAKIAERINQAEQRIITNDILLNALTAYWEWVLAYNQLSVFEDALELTQQRFEGIRESYFEGYKPAVDTLETMIQLQNREFSLNEARVKYQNATQKLSNFLWLDGEVPLQITDKVVSPFLDLEEVRANLPPALDILATQVNRHPELLQYQNKLDQLDVDRRFFNEQLKPELNVNYNFLADQFDFNPNASPSESTASELITQNYKFGATFNFPILLRKQTGKLQLNKIKIEETSLKFLQKRQEINAKLNVVYAKLLNFQQQMELYEQVAQNYERLLEAEIIKFDIGESSIFLVNSREQKLIEAQLKLTKLMASYQQTLVELDWTLGSLGQ